MDSRQLMVLIFVLWVLNFSLRFLPAILLNKFTLPKVLNDWLSYVPVATMAAIVVPFILQGENQPVDFSHHNLNLISALPAVLVAAKTKNLGYTLAVGMGTMALLQWWLR